MNSYQIQILLLYIVLYNKIIEEVQKISNFYCFLLEKFMIYIFSKLLKTMSKNL